MPGRHEAGDTSEAHRGAVGVRALDPSDVVGELESAGLTLTAKVERQPVPEVEYPSRRCYLLAQRR